MRLERRAVLHGGDRVNASNIGIKLKLCLVQVAVHVDAAIQVVFC